MENGLRSSPLLFWANFLSLSSILVWLAPIAARADLPNNVVIVPVPRAHSLAVHPSKPVLYVGRENSTEGRNLVTFKLDDNGRIVEGSRREHADGLIEKEGPLPRELLYQVSALAVHPVLPRLYLGSIPEKGSVFWADKSTFSMAVLELDEDGLPAKKTQSIRFPRRTNQLNFLATNPEGSLLYLSHRSGWLEGMVVREEGDPTLPPFQIKPPMKITFWTHVPQWQRYYAIDRGSQRTIISFSADGRSCPTIQHATTIARSTGGLAVSTKFRKLYASDAVPGKLGVYSLTRDGGFTSVPKYLRMDAGRFLFVDDARNEMIVVAARSGLTVYPLDEEGYPRTEPKKFVHDTGGVYQAMFSPRMGVLYLVCAAP